MSIAAAVKELPATFTGAAAAPSPMSQIVLEHFHGKASRIGVSETACAMRISGFNVAIAPQWMDPADTGRGTKWCRDTHRSGNDDLPQRVAGERRADAGALRPVLPVGAYPVVPDFVHPRAPS